jgi:pyruvate formate lyase activating enzyme
MSLDACRALIDAGLDGLNIDIKGCPDSHRRELRGIDPEIVYRNASLFKEHGVHVEMVYLVVPGFNDDEKCFDWIIDMHLRHLGPDTPLHINRYQRAYKYKARATSISLLERYYESAMKMGLKYVFLGNIWNPKYESTYCPRCKYRVIYRSGNRVRGAKLLKNKCANCGYNILLTGEILL